MTEPWSVEGEGRRLFNEAMLEGARRDQSVGASAIAAIEAGIRAGLTRAAAICGERATGQLASRMSDYRQGAFDEAEACERAIKNEATTKGR